MVVMFLKFERVLKLVRRRLSKGYKIVSMEKMKELAKGSALFMPYGCLHCGQASGIWDFDRVLFVIYPENMSEQELNFVYNVCGGIATLDNLTYGILARCRFCGHSDIFAEPEEV
jgi:hypothetical protein